MEKKQIAIFGGCFNPPLNSHFLLAQQFLNECTQIAKVVFVPVNSKYQKPGLIDNEHRYNMLKLVCDKNPQMEVSRVELESDRQLYTIETLSIFKERNPEFEIVFIMGSDNLKEISTWTKAKELVENFKIYVLERDKDDIKEIIESNEFLTKYKESFIKIQNNITSNLSSTYARKHVKDGKSIRYLTPDSVVEYIEKNKLYR